MLVKWVNGENTVFRQKATFWFQLRSFLSRAILAESVNIFSPSFSHLWQASDKKDDLSVQVYPAFSEYLSHSITKPSSSSRKNTCLWWCKNFLSAIPHSSFTGEICWDDLLSVTLFPLVATFVLNLTFFGSWKHTKATANLGNRHEETDYRDLPASLCGQGARQAEAGLELRAQGQVH